MAAQNVIEGAPVHDSAEIREMSDRLFAVISLYTSGLRASLSLTISSAFSILIVFSSACGK